MAKFHPASWDATFYLRPPTVAASAHRGQVLGEAQREDDDDDQEQHNPAAGAGGEKRRRRAHQLQAEREALRGARGCLA